MDTTSNFIYDIIEKDLAEGRVEKICTRFPPEPNGRLHIGSARAIYINYSSAKKYGGTFNLRFDDTNPVKENEDFVNSIIEDVEWLIGEKPDKICYGSDYFEQCFEYAVGLINDGKAYVCDLSADEMREYRGTLTEPGRNSPYRERSVEENLELFKKMRAGEFPDGYCTLRAKIDMASPNITLRDPVIYRIIHIAHHRQGDKWCIYPMYDFAHPIQDAVEGITHSMCSIEFENNRPLYDWVIENTKTPHKPHQYEFAKLYISYTMMSKRNLIKLVESGIVDGWDDVRMPTLSALRRRGYSPASIMNFVARTGVAKAYSLADIRLLEFCAREELNTSAQRRIAVLEPVKVEIENYPRDKKEFFPVSNIPGNEEASTRDLLFTKTLFIDASDYSESPPPKFHRLKPEGEVRLMGAYIIKHKKTLYKEDGSIDRIICTADMESGNGNPADGRKVKGTIHWLSEENCCTSRVTLTDNLFITENTNDIPKDDVESYINKDSKIVLSGCLLEKNLSSAGADERFQFVRSGYFIRDRKQSDMFIRIVGLKDSVKF